MKTDGIKIVACALALMIGGCNDNRTTALKSESPEQKTGSEAKAPVRPLVTPVALKPGDRGVYRVDMSSMLKDSSEHLLLGLTVEGRLQMVVRSVDGPKAELALRFASPSVRVKGGDPTRTSAKEAALQEELTLPFVGCFEGGALVSMRFARGASAFAAGIWRTVLSGLQTPVAPPDVTTLEGREFDGNGEYTVRYTKTGDGTWRFDKQDYVRGLYESPNASPSQRSPRPELLRASGTLAIEKDLLTRVSKSDAVKVDLLGSGAMISHTDLKLTLDETALPAGDALLSLDVSSMTVLSADEPWRTPVDIGTMDAARMEGLTFDTVLKALVERAEDPRRRGLWAKKNDEAADTDQVQKAEAWTQDWSRYFSALPAFFRQQPETLKRAEKMIRRGSPAATSLIGGLASSGLNSAQQILLKLAKDEKLESGTREAALRNLAQCNLPTLETAKAMRDLYGDEFSGRYAVYGNGIIVRKLRESGQDEAALEGANWLLSLLEKETDRSLRRDILRGLANAGHPAALMPMQQLLDGDVASDRAGALEALRLVDDPVVDLLIARHLNATTEPERTVREAAVQAAATRSTDTPSRQALIDAAQSDPEKRVKTLALKLLQQWATNDPSLQPIVESIASAKPGSVLQP